MDETILWADPRAEAAAQGISDAFAGVRRGRITLHQAQAMDCYGSRWERRCARKQDADRRWEDIPATYIEDCPNALPYLDAASWRYYVPAYMLWVLRQPVGSDSLIIDFTISSLNNSIERELEAHASNRIEMLSDAQSAAVCRFLRYMVARADVGMTDVDAALDGYWGQFCEDTARC